MDTLREIDPQKAFVCYRLPGEGNQFHLIEDGTAENKEDTYRFVFYPFDDRQHPEIQICGLKSPLTLEGISKSPNNTPHSEPTAAYRSMLETALRLIEEERISKIVLSKKIEIPRPTSTSLSTMLGTLANFHPHALVYLFSHPDTGKWMGASPELLLSKKGENYKTTALAGTRLISENRTWTKKELEEQRYVSRFIEKMLCNEKVGDLNIEKTQSAAAGHLEHIKTQFNFTYTGDPKKILSGLHPTPAVCGVPREEARKWIATLEANDRKYYCGYLGEAAPNGDFEYFVNLRCGEMGEDSISIYVGGGITRDSDIQKEWAETEVKSQSLLFAL